MAVMEKTARYHWRVHADEAAPVVVAGEGEAAASVGGGGHEATARRRYPTWPDPLPPRRWPWRASPRSWLHFVGRWTAYRLRSVVS